MPSKHAGIHGFLCIWGGVLITLGLPEYSTAGRLGPQSRFGGKLLGI